MEDEGALSSERLDTGRYLDVVGATRLVGASGTTSALGWAHGKPGFSTETGAAAASSAPERKEEASTERGRASEFRPTLRPEVGSEPGLGPGLGYPTTTGTGESTIDPFGPMPVMTTARRQGLAPCSQLGSTKETLHVFPRFYPQYAKDLLQLRSGANAVNANLKVQFERVEGALDSEDAMQRKHASDVAQRERLTHQLFLERKTRDAQRQRELTAFLGGQVSHAESQRRQQKVDDHDVAGLDPGRTMPLEPPLNHRLDASLKSSLRAVLDEQCGLRALLRESGAAREVERDRFVLSSVQAEQASDHAAAAAKRARDRGVLSGSWEAQRKMAGRLNTTALGQML